MRIAIVGPGVVSATAAHATGARGRAGRVPRVDPDPWRGHDGRVARARGSEVTRGVLARRR